MSSEMRYTGVVKAGCYSNRNAGNCQGNLMTCFNTNECLQRETGTFTKLKLCLQSIKYFYSRDCSKRVSTECRTTRPLDNSPQTTRTQSTDLVVDKRTKNNLYDVKSWVHIFSDSFGSVVDKRTRGYLFEDRGRVVWGESELSGYCVMWPNRLELGNISIISYNPSNLFACAGLA